MKQYLLMCDDSGMQAIKQVCNDTVQFLEVQGMTMNGTAVNILVTPILPPVNPMAPIAVPNQPVPEAPAPEAQPAAV